MQRTAGSSPFPGLGDQGKVGVIGLWSWAPPSCDEGTAWLLLASEGLRSTPGAGAQTPIRYPGEGGFPCCYSNARSRTASQPVSFLLPSGFPPGPALADPPTGSSWQRRFVAGGGPGPASPRATAVWMWGSETRASRLTHCPLLVSDSRMEGRGKGTKAMRTSAVDFQKSFICQHRVTRACLPAEAAAGQSSRQARCRRNETGSEGECLPPKRPFQSR